MDVEDRQGYLLKPVVRSAACHVFLSSGSDVLAERNRFEELTKVLNEQLHWADFQGMHINVVRWEQDAPHRTGGDPNAEFRAQAARAHLTVVLLHDDIRAGTEDELKAALCEDDVQIAVIWMDPAHPRSKKALALKRFLEGVKDELIWDRTGPPGSDQAYVSMARVLSRVVFDVLKALFESGEIGSVHYETR